MDVEYPGWSVTTLSGKVKRNLGERFPGLDIRGTGGYINLIGSLQVGPYRWLREDHRPLPLSALPGDLRVATGLMIAPEPPPAILNRRPSAAGSADPKITSLADDRGLDAAGVLIRRALDLVAIEGRNAAGFWLACQLRDNGFSRGDADTALAAFTGAVPRCNLKGVLEPYSITEARASVEPTATRPMAGEPPEGYLRR